MRGFESRPRYGWHVVQRQDASPLRRSWEFESPRVSNNPRVLGRSPFFQPGKLDGKLKPDLAVQPALVSP
jgi:hypothetical protein